MNDEITNLTELNTNLATFQQELAKLPSEEALNANKAEFQSNWSSDNAAAFLANYDKVKECISRAVASLNNYYTRLEDVRTRFVTFDNTINKVTEE